MTPRSFWVTLVTSARTVFAEPAGLVVTVGFYAAVVSVLGTLWRTAIHANGGMVAGYTAAALSWYVVTSEIVTVPLNTRLIEAIGDDIGSGAVAVELLRPASVLGVRVAAELGRVAARTLACAPAAVLLAWGVAGRPPSWPALLLALPAIALASACNVVGQHAFAAISFWIRDARSTWFLYQKLVFVVGGMLLPLEVLPHPVERVARLTPFMAMAYAPARLAAGHFEPLMLVVQLAWLAVLTAIALAVFGAGERRLQVVGG